MYNEEGCTYTLIHVLKQENEDKCNAYKFKFAINSKHNITIPLVDYTTIMFSGLMLTHRQTFEPDESHEKATFVNFGSYGNRKLFNHIRRSVLRNTEV